MTPTLPEQFNAKDLGFVKLLPRSKKPFEKDWPRHPFPVTDIAAWVALGNNYGVLGGYGDLVVVDADSPEMAGHMKKNAPLTFTVKTPKKGSHFYFLCRGIDKKINLKRNGQDHGEIISFGAQVVGPGSIHPDTGTAYQIETDAPIANIDHETLLSLLSDYIPSEPSGPTDQGFQSLVDQYGEPYYLNDYGTVSSVNQNFWAGLHHAEHIQLYEPDEGCFYRYDEKTGIYTDITEDIIRTEISKRILEISRGQRLPSLERKRTAGTLNQIIALTKGISEKRHAFQKNSNYVHLANGVIVFNDQGEADLKPFSPELLSRNYCPIFFDEKARCDRFLNELIFPAIKEPDALLIQKYVGLCLLGNNLLQRFLILEGTPGGGKSTLALIIQKLIGQSNVTELRTQQLSGRFELYRYLKKTLLVGVDVPGNFLSEKGAYVIKGLVGGDFFDAEQKGGTGCFQMQGNFCILITSNARLRVRLDGDIGAWKRRLLIVRYEAPPPVKKIPHFDALLMKEEGSGILNWALQGLALLLQDIKEHGDIRLAPSQEGVVDALLAESDSLRNFLIDTIAQDEGSDLTVSEIIESYARYCPGKGWNAKPITVIEKELAGLMLELFATSKAQSIERYGKSARGFRHVRFIDKDANNGT